MLDQDDAEAAFVAQVAEAQAAALEHGWVPVGQFDDYLAQEKAATSGTSGTGDTGEEGEAEDELLMLFTTADGETFTKWVSFQDYPPVDGEFGGIEGDPGQEEVAEAQWTDPGAVLAGPKPITAAHGGGSSQFPKDFGSSVPDPGTIPAVIGDDWLVSVPQAWLSLYPWRNSGKVSARLKGYLRDEQGSGTMIGPRHVITAGHVVYINDLDSWIHFSSDWISTFRPGQFNDTTQPNGAGRLLVGAWSTYQYVVNNNWSYDVGWLLLFDQASTASLGWYGMCWGNDAFLNGSTMTMHGYPASKPYSFSTPNSCRWSPLGQWEQCGGYQYYDNQNCDISSVSSTTIYSDCDTLSGMSGAALWAYPSGGGPCVYGAHRASHNSQSNAAWRMTSFWIGWIRDNVICPNPSQYAGYSGC